MESSLNKALSWVEKHEKKLLWGAILSFFVVISGLCLAKYARLGYDAIDLAYFNQVFWNTVRGRFFQQSIHPHLSLGDHAELIIPLLAPFYALWQDPRMLLLLQAAVLALSAWPVWLLAKNRFQAPLNEPENFTTRFAPLLFAFVWLGGPLLQNIAFFEFHILPFAILPLLFALLAYRHEKRRAFLAWTVLALLVREDVALVVMGLSLFAFFDRKSPWWCVIPLALGASWFAGAMALIKAFSPAGGYKFAIYYGWLGDSIPSMAMNAVMHPIAVAQHMLTLPNLEMLLGLLMPFAFLPVAAPIALLLSAGPAAQMLLGGASGGALILETHYSTLFLPALLLAAMEGYARASGVIVRIVRGFSIQEARVAVPILLVVATVYSSAAYGPIPGALAKTFTADPGRAAAVEEMLSRIPANAAVASSYALLPMLSSRERLYSAHYLFLGKTQFGEADYPIPKDLRHVVLESDETISYRAQFPKTTWTKPLYDDGLERLAAAAGTPVARIGQVMLFDRRPGAMPMAEMMPARFGEPMEMKGFSLLGAEVRVEGAEATLVTEWQVPSPPADSIVITLALRDKKGRIIREVRSSFETLPSAFVSHDGRRVITVAMRLDGLEGRTLVPELRLERTEALVTLDGDRSMRVSLKVLEALGTKSFPEISVSSR